MKVEPYIVGPDGWLVGVERVPHPESKRYPETNTGEGMAWHSMEGWYAGSMGVLADPDRGSWKFSNKLSGYLVQHCPVTCSCWASGNQLVNTRLWATENEGIWHMPITPEQVATNLRLIRTWEVHTGRKATREGRWGAGRTMHEHREVATLITPNAGPTACPSERYAPLWAALAETANLEEDEVTREEYESLIERLDNVQFWTMETRAALTGAGFRDPKNVSNDDIVAQSVALQKWNKNGNSLLDGYAGEQALNAKQSALIAQLAEQIAGGDTSDAYAVAEAMKEIAQQFLDRKAAAEGEE